MYVQYEVFFLHVELIKVDSFYYGRRKSTPVLVWLSIPIFSCDHMFFATEFL